MINITQKEKCSGCSACAASCPVGCITMQRDGEGFLYPSVDREKCISCSLCERVCERAALTYGNHADEPRAYAARSKNEEERACSASGGVFSLLAREILNMGGAVFGAASVTPATVRHVCVESESDLHSLRSSKYVQSDMGNSYSEVKRILGEGRYVLFCGTPCQVGGLLAFLGKEYQRLFCADIFCHGVPSPLALESYIGMREEKAGDRACEVLFRDKRLGWETFSMVVRFEGGEEYSERYDRDIYMKAFLSNKSLRPSCYECRFKTLYRPADITLADFWGIDSVCPGMNDGKGTSLVLANTAKGGELLMAVSGDIELCVTDLQAAVGRNRAATVSSRRHPGRDRFMRLLTELPFDKAHKKTEPCVLLVKAKRLARRILKRRK